MRWTIRTAVPDDHHAVVAVVDDWWGRPLSGLLQPLFLGNFSSTSLVAESPDGQLTGFLVGFVSGDNPHLAYVHFVGVSPLSRNAGLGRMLYERFVERVAPFGVREVRCVTSVVNRASVAFHESIGFEVIGHTSDPGVDGGEYVELARAVAPYRGPVGLEMRWPPDDRLVGQFVELVQTVPADAKELLAALDHPSVWQHLTVPRPVTANDMSVLIDAYRQSMTPWTVRLRRPVRGRDAGEVVGWSSYLEVSAKDGRLEIGATSYSPHVWGSVVNPECKLLLLTHAFDDLGASRVQLKTDLVNHRSQDAIARLGAVREGVLRRYQRRLDDTLRNTVLYSITAREWPTVRDGLESRIAAFPASEDAG
jgi:RimJ/RimL family protein N-acetyltransferase